MPEILRIEEKAVHTMSLFAESDSPLFEVRPPQRRFKWQRLQIEQLWKDVLAAYKRNVGSYFLGPLLLVPLDGGGQPKVSVIDGQQRITAMSLLLAILRDRCVEFPKLRRRSDNIQKALTRVDFDGNPISTVMTLQEPEKRLFDDLVRKPGSTTNLPEQKSLLIDAVKNLKRYVDDYMKNLDPAIDEVEELRQLCEFVQTKVDFLPLEVGDESEGYLVFDTSNTRGLHLSASEELKARLATVAREDKNASERFIGDWNEAASKLDQAGLPIDTMDDYLHAIWSSKEGYNSKGSFNAIAEHLVDAESGRVRPQTLREFGDEIRSYIDSFLSVVNPTGRERLDDDLRDLRSLNTQSVTLLTMVHKHFADQFEEAVGLVLSLQIRNITFGDVRPNDYQHYWPRWAVRIRAGEIKDVFDEMRRLMVSDDDFVIAMEKATVSASSTVKHVLRRLDPINRPGGGVYVVGVEVEHIMPRSVVRKLVKDKRLTRNAKNWIEDMGFPIPETPEDKLKLGQNLEQGLNRLGNLALLDIVENRGAQDRRFEDKKDFYTKQQLILTKDLLEQDTWDISHIVGRQKEMAKRAPQVWRK